MMAVAQRVAVADGDDGDRGQHRAALLGEPDALPARADGRGGAELAVELRRPARLERAVDGGERDLAYPATGAGAAAQPALVEDLQASARPAAEAAQQRGAQAAARGAVERALGVDVSGAGEEHESMIGCAGRSDIGHME